jgi:hypothetical protein
MKSVDKLRYMFLAGLSHNKWQLLNFKHDGAKGIESLLCCEKWYTGNLRLCTHFEFKAIVNMHNSSTFRYTRKSLGSPMTVVTTDQVLHLCLSHLAIMSEEVLLSCWVKTRHTCLEIRTNAAAFAAKWSKFWCAGASSAYILSDVMTASAQYICQYYLALRHFWWFWVLQL